MTDPKCFIDSNVLVYLIAQDKGKKNKVYSILDRNCIISTQVVNENINACLRKLKLSKDQAYAHGNFLLNNFEIALILKSTIIKAFWISDRYQVSFWDSLIISSALENNCAILYSEDLQHGQVIEGNLTIINPYKD